MRLETEKRCRLREREVRVAAHVGFTRGNRQRRLRRHGSRGDDVFRNVALGKELDPDAGMFDRGRFVVRVQVNLKTDLVALPQEFRGAVRVEARRSPFGQVRDQCPHCAAAVGVARAVAGAARASSLDIVREDVVDDLRVLGDDFHPLDIAIFSKARRHDRLRVRVGPNGRNRNGRARDNEVRLAEPPMAGRRPHPRRRRVGGIAPRRAAVHPLRNRRDLRVAQGRIGVVLADCAAAEPRRHVAVADLLLDGTRPRPRIFVRLQRKRRHVTGPVTILAGLLKDRQDVFRERRIRGDR